MTYIKLCLIRIIALFNTVEFQSSVHACGCQPIGVSSEANTGCRCCVIVEHFELSPLLAQVNSARENGLV